MRKPALSIIAVLSVVAASAFAASDQNPPWFPSLNAFEHYDSERTHLFEQARFGGSHGGRNQVDARFAHAVYPSGYNMVYLNPNEVFVYGGGYGNIRNSTGAFVAKVDPDTLRPIWRTKLIDTRMSGEWDYPGVLALLDDGFLYVIYGYRLAKIDPQTGKVVRKRALPVGNGAPEDTSFNGFDALPDGTLIAKTVYRLAGCKVQGPTAILPESMGGCPPNGKPPILPIMVSINPRTLQVIDVLQLPAVVAGRPTTTRFGGNDYVYFATTARATPPGTMAQRYLIQNGKFYQDTSWNPVIPSGLLFGTAVAIMNDWFVVQNNTLPTGPSPLTVVAINQADANQQFSLQPFKDFPPSLPECTATLGEGTVSFAPMSVSVDPDHNLIYAADSVPGRIAALKLTASGLRTVWTAKQRTTEFLALIGPRGQRVLVDTDIPDGQCPLENSEDDVVWRDAQTGDELARTEKPLPAMTSGTMIQPYYNGMMFYTGLHGELIELAVRPRATRHDH